MAKYFLLIVVLLTTAVTNSFSQKKDSVRLLSADSVGIIKKDSAVKKHSPRKAAIFSAVLPGLGQVYNKKYWKVPIVYAAIGVTGGILNYNLKGYRNIRFAYNALLSKGPVNFSQVAPELQPYITYNAINDLRTLRNDFRKNIDYSVLFLIFFWGLNVVDATVDAHLRGFDVSDDLSLRLKPGFDAGTNSTGITLAFDLHKPTPKLLALPTSY